MYAVRIEGPRRIGIVEVARPGLSGPAAATVQVTTATIAPIELERYAGPDRWSVTPGGTCAGIVEATGTDVQRWRPGDPVLVSSSLRPATPTGGGGPTGGPRLLGRDLPGSHAGWVDVPDADTNLVAIADPLTLEAPAVLAADVYAAAEAAASSISDRSPRSVLLAGCDAGCLAFLLAWKRLARHDVEVVALDRIPSRVIRARRSGATGIVIRSGSDPVTEIGARIGARTFDAAVVGPQIDGGRFDVAAELVSRDGPIVLLDPPGTGFRRPGLADRDARVWVPGTPDTAALAELISGRETVPDLLPLVTHTLPLADAAAAYEWALERREGAIKLLLKA